jgi:hypothetical protein
MLGSPLPIRERHPFPDGHFHLSGSLKSSSWHPEKVDGDRSTCRATV